MVGNSTMADYCGPSFVVPIVGIVCGSK